MRKLISLIATMAGVLMVALMGTPAVAADLPNPLGLRGFNVGMTLDEMRQLKFPDPTTDDVRLICSGDKLSDEAGLNPLPGREPSYFGTKTCAFFAVANGKVRKVSMIVGGPDARVTFAFTPKASGPAVSERLFYIVAEVKSAYFSELDAAYVAKFGQPDRRGRLPDRDMFWTSRHASLSFFDHQNEISIVYADAKLEQLVHALKKTMGKPGADKL